MADLIDRAALLADIDEAIVYSGRIGTNAEMRGANKIVDRIKAVKAIDAVEVVRCKDCKHYNKQMTSESRKGCTIDAEYDEDVRAWYGFISYPSPEFYCAAGKRRTDADN
jgi:hypothetical protein